MMYVLQVVTGEITPKSNQFLQFLPYPDILNHFNYLEEKYQWKLYSSSLIMQSSQHCSGSSGASESF